MIINLLDSFENNCFFDSGADGGGAGNQNKTEDKKDDKADDGKSKEETITLTQAELETRLNNKFAEGARKAQEGKLTNNPANQQKVSTGENVGEDVKALRDEIATFKAEKTALSLGINPSYSEDLVALCKGKGLELTEENLKKEADKRPEWKLQNNGEGGGVKILGSTAGKTATPPADEKELAAKMFGL